MSRRRTRRNRSFNGKGIPATTTHFYKLFNAQRHGAIALLTMPDPNHRDRCAGTPRGAGGSGQQAAMRPRIPPEALADGGLRSALYRQRARRKQLTRKRRQEGRPMCRRYRRKLPPVSFALPGISIEFRTVLTRRRRANSYNVVGLLEGSDPALKAETIVLQRPLRSRWHGAAGI